MLDVHLNRDVYVTVLIGFTARVATEQADLNHPETLRHFFLVGCQKFGDLLCFHGIALLGVDGEPS